MKLYTIECDPACGFMVRSHDKSEAVSMAKAHLKTVHSKDMSSDEISDMVTETDM